jgi:hypothetical protein
MRRPVSEWEREEAPEPAREPGLDEPAHSLAYRLLNMPLPAERYILTLGPGPGYAVAPQEAEDQGRDDYGERFGKWVRQALLDSPAGLAALRAFERARLRPKRRTRQSVRNDLRTLAGIALACFAAAQPRRRSAEIKALKRRFEKLRQMAADSARILRARGKHLVWALAAAKQRARIGDRAGKERALEDMWADLLEALAASLAAPFPDALKLGNMACSAVLAGHAHSGLATPAGLLYATSGRTRKPLDAATMLGFELALRLKRWSGKPRFGVAAAFVRAALGVSIESRTLKERVNSFEKNVRFLHLTTLVSAP